MISQLERDILGLAPGTHACLLYGSPEERQAVVDVFLTDGHAVGDRCMHVPEEEADALYLPDGRFEPEPVLRMLDDVASEAPALGHPVFRATGDMSWALKGAPGTDRLIAYEEEVNARFTHRPVLFLCQYDRVRFPADVLRDVLLSHAVVIVDYRLHRNPFYDHPELVPDDLAADEQVAWILERLRA